MWVGEYLEMGSYRWMELEFLEYLSFWEGVGLVVVVWVCFINSC